MSHFVLPASQNTMDEQYPQHTTFNLSVDRLQAAVTQALVGCALCWCLPCPTYLWRRCTRRLRTPPQRRLLPPPWPLPSPLRSLLSISGSCPCQCHLWSHLWDDPGFDWTGLSQYLALKHLNKERMYSVPHASQVSAAKLHTGYINTIPMWHLQ